MVDPSGQWVKYPFDARHLRKTMDPVVSESRHKGIIPSTSLISPGQYRTLPSIPPSGGQHGSQGRRDQVIQAP